MLTLRTICAVGMCGLVVSIGWHYRHAPVVQAWWAKAGSPSATASVVPAAPAGHDPGLATGQSDAGLTGGLLTRAEPMTVRRTVRKCVRGDVVLYTDDHCPHGTAAAAMTGGTFNVLPSSGGPSAGATGGHGEAGGMGALSRYAERLSAAF